MADFLFAPCIDWLTLATYTFPAYTKACADLRKFFGKGWKQARWLQYDGAHHPDGAFYGHAVQSNEKEHYIVRVSGAMAHEWFNQPSVSVYDNGAFLSAMYCTRIDIQVTSYLPRWWNVRHLHDHYKSKGRYVSMVQSETGSTLYVGARSSMMFTRFYEKPIGDETYLRLEFEIKGDQARWVFANLLNGELTVTTAWYAYLEKLRMDADHAEFYGQVDIGIDFPKFLRESDANGRLKWLQSLIPRFHQMANDHDIGDRVRSIFDNLAQIDNKEDSGVD